MSQNKSMLDESKCKALFYGSEAAAAIGLSDHGSTDALHASMICVPSLEDLLQVPENTKLYPYLKTFEEARDEPCLILHSSGSTRRYTCNLVHNWRVANRPPKGIPSWSL